MKIYIYVIYFSTSNKLSPYYIGQTAYLERRMFEHLNSKYLVGRALRKYDDWAIEVLHIAKSRDAANLLEIEEIRHYNSIAPNGYNLTRGGDGFFGKHTKESKKKMGHPGNKNPMKDSENVAKIKIALQGNQNAKGFKHSKEYGRDISKRMQGNQNAKGFCHTEEAKNKMGGIKMVEILVVIKPHERSYKYKEDVIFSL